MTTLVRTEYAVMNSGGTTTVTPNGSWLLEPIITFGTRERAEEFARDANAKRDDSMREAVGDVIIRKRTVVHSEWLDVDTGDVAVSESYAVPGGPGMYVHKTFTTADSARAFVADNVRMTALGVTKNVTMTYRIQ